MATIQCISISKIHGSGEGAVTALAQTNLTIPQGEMVAITGPSGSGKSTLLHLLSGLDSPTSGQVFYNNKNLYDMKEAQRSVFRRKNIGFIFQDFQLIPVLTALENIKMPALLDGREPDKKWLGTLVESLGIENRLDHLPDDLSGGQKQRVAIARAMIMQPSILFADEPTGNLDASTGNDVLSLLTNAAKSLSSTLVIVTHDKNVAKHMQKILSIIDGKVTNEVR